MEGWLSIPNRANIKRYGWKKQVRVARFLCSLAFLLIQREVPPTLLLFVRLQYVVVSSKKILFYNDEQDKEQSNPSMVLDIE